MKSIRRVVVGAAVAVIVATGIVTAGSGTAHAAKSCDYQPGGSDSMNATTSGGNGSRQARQLPLVGQRLCVGCGERTETGIALTGPGDWPVTVLIRMGWTYEEAMIVIAHATGCLSTLPTGERYATVPRERITLLMGLCTGCAQRYGNWEIEPIASSRAPLYDHSKIVNPAGATRDVGETR